MVYTYRQVKARFVKMEVGINFRMQPKIIFAKGNEAFEYEQYQLFRERCEQVLDNIFLLVAITLQLQPLGGMFFVLGLRVFSNCAGMGEVGTYCHCFDRSGELNSRCCQKRKSLNG
jgi:hypothetical protein